MEKSWCYPVNEGSSLELGAYSGRKVLHKTLGLLNINEDGTWRWGKRELHVLCFGPGSAEVRMGKLKSFQFPSHTAVTSHHTLLPCISTAAAPHSPHFFCLAPSPRLLTPAAASSSSLASPKPASGSVCAGDSKHTAGWGEEPHPRYNAREALTHIANGPCNSCPWSGTALLLSSWDRGPGQV